MNGIIVINKEKGYTSNDIVQIVKKTLNEKVGHTGTLDPLATGVLPLLVGKGTKLSKYLINHDKTYIATIALGLKKDTGDNEGKVIEEKIVKDEMLETNKVKCVLDEFIGDQMQKPPIYSAIKIKGKKLYEYARNGEEVEIPFRKINIYDIKLIKIDRKSKKIMFEVSCSKGTYIRTLCEDIAEKLGTVGYMSDLNRCRVGNFSLSNSIKINDLQKNLKNNFITIEEFFKDKNQIRLKSTQIKDFLNGVKIFLDKNDGIYRIYESNIFLGVGIVKNKVLKRDIIEREDLINE